MKLDAMTCIPSFIEIGLGLQKLIGRGTHIGTLTKRKTIS
jgi:hypothetical protein